MEFVLSTHARHMLQERQIPEAWVWRTLTSPERREVGVRLRIDKENDALYLRLDETAVVESEEVQPGIILDYNADNQVVGIEILNLTDRVPPERLRVFQLETT